jgi:Transposase
MAPKNFSAKDLRERIDALVEFVQPFACHPLSAELMRRLTKADREHLDALDSRAHEAIDFFGLVVARVSWMSFMDSDVGYTKIPTFPCPASNENEEAFCIDERRLPHWVKEDLRQIWMQPRKHMARVALKEWLVTARSSGVRILEQFADTLEEHQEGVLNYYDYRISTGPLEGTNSKIKLVNRQAYGFRDHEFLKLKILGLHETKYALVG